MSVRMQGGRHHSIARRLIALLALLLATFGALAPATASAEEPGVSISTPPVHQKLLSDINDDGTYDLTLTVRGETDSAVAEQRANVLVIFDASNSMIQNNTPAPGGGWETRMEAAKRSINQLSSTLLGLNTAANADIVEMALLSFNTTTTVQCDWTSDLDTFQTATNTTGNDAGTNWELALNDGKALADAKAADGDPTYVIFVTDGNPSMNMSGWVDYSIGYNSALPRAKAIVDAGYHFYTIGVYGQVSYLQRLTNYAYTGNANTAPTSGTYYYSAGDTPALQSALDAIAAVITKTITYRDVTINDRLDSVNMDFANIGAAGTPEYVLTKRRVSTGEVIATYDSATDTLSGTWDYATPTFNLPDKSLSWAPEANAETVLDNDVTYSITVKVKATQAAYDAIADETATLHDGDNNGDGADDAQGLYSNDNDHATVSFRTILTETSSSGGTTSTTSDLQDSPYNKPVFTPGLSTITITKHWAGDDHEQTTPSRPDSLSGTVTRDAGAVGEKTYNVTLTPSASDPNVYTTTLQVPAGPEGHTYTFAETVPAHYTASAVTAAATGSTSSASGGTLTLMSLSPQAGSFEITNTYEATGSIVLSATKELEGRVLEDDQFEFTLTGADDGVSQTKKNAANGTITFDEIAYTAPGTYTYTITETEGGGTGYVNDTHTETVTVTVVDTGDGTLSATAQYDADGAVFTNTFVAVPVAVLKQSSGEGNPALGGAQFTLYLDDGNGTFGSEDAAATTYSDDALTTEIAGSVVTTGSNGRAVFYGLVAGQTYWLKETRAPVGYNLDTQAHAIVVAADGTISTLDSTGASAALPIVGGIATITISDDPLPILPGTAGAGIAGILLAGSILVLGGGGSVLHGCRRTSERTIFGGTRSPHHMKDVHE